MRLSWLDMNLNCEGVCYYFVDSDSLSSGSAGQPAPNPGAASRDKTDRNICSYYSYGDTVSYKILNRASASRIQRIIIRLTFYFQNYLNFWLD